MGKERGGVFSISSKYSLIFSERYQKRSGKEEKGECLISQNAYSLHGHSKLIELFLLVL